MTRPSRRQRRGGTTPLPPAPPRPPLWPALGLRRHLALIAALGAAALLAYADSFGTGFALDNRFLLLEDPRLRQASAENVKLILLLDYWWPKATSGLFRPVTTLSYLLDYAVLGHAGRPAGWHVVNLLLHWGNATCVYFLALTLLGSAASAFLLAGLFVVHPMATESVTNVVGRADLLAALSVLGGTLLYVRASREAGRRKLPWLAGLLLTTAAGVFAKESAVVIVGIVVLYDVVHRDELGRAASPLRRAGELAAGWVVLLPPLLALAWVRARLYGNAVTFDVPFTDNPLVGADFWTARLTALEVVGRYVALLLWPRLLSCDYSYAQIPVVAWAAHGWENARALLAAGGVVAVAAAALRARRRAPALAFFALFVLVTLLPGANLLTTIGTIMAERLLYLPSIGFVGCLVVGVTGACRRFGLRREIAWVLLGVIGLAYGVRTAARNLDWRDDVTLWRSAVVAAPRSYKAHASLAYAIAERDDPEFRNIDFVIAQAEEALAIVDEHPLPAVDQPRTLLLQLGVYYRTKGATRRADAAEATAWYRRSAAVLERAVALDRAANAANRRKALARGLRADEVADVGNYEIYYHLALVDSLLSRPAEAIDALTSMRHLAPNNPAAHVALARAYTETGELENASRSALAAVALDPGRQEAWQLLLDVYRKRDAAGCAVVVAHGGAQLDFGCATVHADACAAYRDLVRLYLDARQPALAGQLRRRAVGERGCAPAPLDALLAGAAPAPP